MDSSKSTRYEDFLSLYSVNQKRIFGYIISLVPCRVDAEDVLQQTAMEMWRLFDRFEPETNFAAWGISIARFRILKFRKEHRKTKEFVAFLNDEAFQLILDESEKHRKNPNSQLSALQGCVKRLRHLEKELLIQRYEKELTYQCIAEKMNCSLSMIYRRMTMIHTNLLRCIRRTVAMWDAK